jgi:hypothetical protein
MVIGTDYTGNNKSNYRASTTTADPWWKCIAYGC